jgi:metallo-beta-lactamase class B
MTSLKKIIVALFSALAILLLVPGAVAANRHVTMPRMPSNMPQKSTCQSQDDWSEATYARHIYGNSWYVGTCGISVVLIASRQGHILIDSGPETAYDAVRQSILSLGLKLSDIKTILMTHEHHDHMGGMARFQTVTGAKVLSRANVVEILTSGKNDNRDPQFEELRGFPAIRHVIAFDDASTVRLGKLRLQHIPMTGHAPGGSGWRWQECEKGLCKNLVFADSLGSISDKTYRYSAADSLATALKESSERLAATACDILITGHGTASNLLDRLDGKSELVEPGACINFAKAGVQRLEKRLGDENKD